MNSDFTQPILPATSCLHHPTDRTHSSQPAHASIMSPPLDFTASSLIDGRPTGEEVKSRNAHNRGPILGVYIRWNSRTRMSA